MTDMVKVRVPGTTANCGPGFDSIGIACNIYNELELKLLTEDKIELEVEGEGKGLITADKRNVVWKAIEMVLNKSGRTEFKGAKMRMRNDVPLSRGLGSSAAAIVAGLAAANAAIGNPFTKQDLFVMATEMEGHPDNVAPAIFGGMTLSVQNESAPHTLSFMPSIDLKLVVAIPGFNLSTKMARKVLPETVSMPDAVYNIGRAALLVGALCKGDTESLKYALDDKLHQPYRMTLIPGMEEVLKNACAAGAIGAVLSGAGPCLIAFSTDKTTEIGHAMTETFKKYDVPAKYVVLKIDSDGVKEL